MKLVSARIRNYKCIDDTGPFTLSDVTALVGKNESGKTAVLTALEKLKPVTPNRESFTSLDFPRRLWRPSQVLPTEPPVVESEWKLEAAEMAALAEEFGAGAVPSDKVKVTKGYDNVLRVSAEVNEAALIKHVIDAATLTPTELAALGERASSIEQLASALAEMEPVAGGYAALKSSLAVKLPKGVDQVNESVEALLPRMIYFSDYHKLAGQVSLTAFIERKNAKQQTSSDLLFEALLSLAGTTPQKVQELSQFEQLNASLRAVSNQISDEIFSYWSQNKHLEVVLRFDNALPNDPPPFNSGYVFRTRIDNKRHKADTSFDDRSTGFVWFFSFLVWFSQLKHRYGNSLLVLLDEPGLTLHARAQADLLRYINERLRPDHQVIYSTHSPFMIDPDNLLSARTVEDVVGRDGSTLGTKVGDRVLSTDPDTISPLQRALDYELTQSLFVGKYTLLVEGPADLAYVKWFSKQCELRGRQALDYRWTICICGGVDKIPPFASLFAGNGLHIAALVDVQAGSKQRLANAKKAVGEGRVLSMDKYVQKAEADIEDLFEPQFYCDLVNHAYNLTPTQHCSLDTYDPKSRILKQVEDHFNLLPASVDTFDHYKPAAWLFDNAEAATKFSGFDASLERMAKVIEDLNKLID